MLWTVLFLRREISQPFFKLRIEQKGNYTEKKSLWCLMESTASEEDAGTVRIRGFLQFVINFLTKG